MKRRLYALTWISLLLTWVGYALAGGWLAEKMVARTGDALLRVGQGKFNDPIVFVHQRMEEMLWLTSLLLSWIALHWLLEYGLTRRPAIGCRRWVAHGVAGFILLNVWVGAASHTALFWGVMGAGSGVENYMQFNFKRILFEEIRSPRRAVLVGSSQTRAEIDENLLNDRLGPNLWTSELHFPGSKAYDLLLVEPELRRADPQLVICYFTEGYLYVGSQGLTAPNFFSFSKLPDAWRRGALAYLSRQEIGYGLLGDVLPLFRCRGILSQRLLGFAALNLPQTQYDAALPSDLQERARREARGFHLNAESDFQKQAFEDFVYRCERAGRRVILIVGGYNPILTPEMDPAIRADMLAFIDGLKIRHANMIAIDGERLAPQTAADYQDLNHVTPAMQRRFTEALADWLEHYLAQPRSPAPGNRSN